MPWYVRWRNVFRSEKLNEELDTELEFHLAETVDRLVSEGISPKDALRQARLRLGNYAAQKERTRDMNVAAWLDTTRADLIFGMRQLRASPGFAFVAAVSLALGIGANTAMFQLVNAIRLKMLPVQEPQELVSIDFARGSARSGSWYSRSANFTFSQWQEIRAQQQAFSGVVAWSAARFDLTTGGESRFAEGLYVSGRFFRDLGVSATLGRTFNEADDTTACSVGAVLSYPFWQREFGSDPGILGRPIRLDGHAVPVIGVTGPAFFGVEVGSRFDVAVPLCADRVFGKGRIGGPSSWWLSMLGRLKPGWTAERATAHLRAISPAIMHATLPAEYKPDFARRYLANQLIAKEAGTGISALRSDYERPLWLLMATSGLVLIIACANLANLLLARATVREPEIAVRLAIGASRWRLLRQLLAESLLLASAGAVLGACLAVTLSRVLVAFISSAQNPVFIDVATDWRVLAYTAALAVLTCLLFGLLPALRSSYLSPASAMRSGARGVTAGPQRFSMRRALVVTQVALSLVLMVGALLFTRSLHNLLTADAGFLREGVLTVTIDLSKASYPEKQRPAIDQELSGRLSLLPGALSVAQVGSTPVSGNTWDSQVGPDGAPAAGSGKQAFFNRAAPDYFRTMGTRVLAGREFNHRDTLTSPRVAIVNQMFARSFFGGGNPVGRTFHLEATAGRPEPLFQIVGLIENTKYHSLKEDFKPIAFFPIAQDSRPAPDALFVMRIAGAPGPIMTAAKRAIGSISPSIGIEFRAFSAQLQDSLLRERLMATLSGGFGLLAGLLATLGLYGVIAYMVARRRHEIGVRIAVGASRGEVLRLVLREAILLLGVGITVGSLLSLWAGKAVASLLFGLQPADAISLVFAVLLLGVVTLMACYIPARRAATLDPITTLRND